MKQTLRFTLLGLLLIGSISACKKKSTSTPPSTSSNNVVVDIPYTKSVTLPEVPALPLSLPFEHTDTFATLVDEFISPYGFTKADILSVTPVSMNVTIDNSSPQTFNFVDDSAKVYVDAYNGTNPTLVAYVKNIPLNAKSIDFTVVNTDFKDYFNSEYMQVTLKCNTRANEGMANNSTFITNFKFRITAKKK